MTAVPRPLLPLTFAPWALEAEAAMLGARRLGSVMWANGARRVRWMINLSDWPVHGGEAASVEMARRQIADQVDEWLESLGVTGPGQGVQIVVQGERGGAERVRA